MKNKVFLITLGAIIVMIAKMYHPILFIFFFVYLGFITKQYGFKISIVIVLVSILIFNFALSLPTAQDINIKGKIVKKNESSVIIKMNFQKVIVYGDFLDLDYGDKVDITVYYMEMMSNTNDNAFNYQNYLYSIGVSKSANLVKINNYQKVDNLYKVINSRISSNQLINSYSNLLLFGIKDDNIQQTYEALSNLSIVHMFALSGMHLSILSTIIMSIVSLLFNKHISKALTFLLLGIYVFSIPYNISLIRAFLVMMGSSLFKKYLNKLDILGLCAFLMIFINPYILYNISFIFSYGIYLIIVLLNNYKYSSYLIFLGSLPIIISINYSINVFGLLLSIALVPLIKVIYIMLLGSLIIGKLLTPIIIFLLTILANIVKMFSDISKYIYFSKPTLLFICVYYYLYFKIILKVNIKVRYQKELACILGLLISFYYYPSYSMVGRVVMIDVGQGDCFLINQPFNQGNILIDTGGLASRDVAKNNVVPYLRSIGIKKLDYVFISHEDYDHCGALPSLQQLIPVKNIINSYQDKIKIGDVIIEMLTTDKVYDNPNDNSLIIKATVNQLNYLFTGDISRQVEKDLYYKYQSLDIDVLKVGHHGSNSSSSEFLFKMISPKVALISCGKNNTYGHPHKTVLNHLNAYGIKVIRSDQTGMATIMYYGQKNYIYE